MPSKTLIRTIISGSSSSKLLSRLKLLRFTLTIPISSQRTVASPESSSKKSKRSCDYISVKSLLLILLVTNQSGINLNAARESSTASSHIFFFSYTFIRAIWYTIKKRYKEAAKSHVFWVLYSSGIESNLKKHLWTAL